MIPKGLTDALNLFKVSCDPIASEKQDPIVKILSVRLIRSEEPESERGVLNVSIIMFPQTFDDLTHFKVL
jgi:hypothetical protein